MIGGGSPAVSAKPILEPAHGTPEVRANAPSSEMAVVAMGGRTPPDAAPLVADLGASASGGGEDVAVEAFVAAPRARA